MCLLGICLICTLYNVQMGRINECFQQPETKIMCEWEVILPLPVLLQLPSTHMMPQVHAAQSILSLHHILVVIMREF